VAVPDETLDCGPPISYLVLEKGTAVYASSDERIGVVERVLYVEQEDVFDGIVILTDNGPRFLGADCVDRIHQRCVRTTLSVEQATELPPPQGGPPVFKVDPAEAIGPSFRERIRRLFGKGGWQKRSS
jgi:hypothetical protein